MSDIKNIKDLLAEELKWFPTLADDRIFKAATSLITTIESLEINKEQDATQYGNLRALYYEMEREIEQKDVLIESQKEEIESKQEIIEHLSEVGLRNFHFMESQKAITELAVKGLKKVLCVRHDGLVSSEIFTGEVSAGQEKCQEIAQSALDQIERLSHE